MAWEAVDSGELDGGGRYVIERRVRRIPVPYTNALVIPVDSYRWRSIAADGQAVVRATGLPRSGVEASIRAFQDTGSPG